MPCSAQVPDEDKSITIAVFRNAQPVIFVDKHGRPAGIYPDLLEIILHDAGYNVRYLVFDTFQEAFEAAASRKVDIMPALQKSAEREKLFDYGTSTVFVAWSQVFTSEGSTVESIFDLRDRRIGLMAADQNARNFINLMSSFEISFESVIFNNFDEITQALVMAEIDAGVYFSTYLNEEFQIKPTDIVFSPSNSYLAVPAGTNSELLQEIDDALREAKEDNDSFYYEILGKYRLIYQEQYLPQWLIILVISLSVLAVTALVFVLLLRFLVKRTTIDLLIEKKHAEESDRLKTGFLSKVSHELRTPLNGIMGMHTLLNHTDLNKDQELYLNLASQASHSLNKIIQDLLDLNESTAPELELKMSSININEVIMNVVSYMRIYAAKKQIGIEYHPHDEEIFWKTDSSRLKQVLIQLLFNAVDFSEEGIITIEAEISRNLQIKIKDQGRGIAPGHLKEVFIPFHQLEHPFTRQQGGLGVGLTIARQLCKKLNGEIEINSEEEKGSEFIIRLY